MATALIQFTQGATTDVAGRAVRGVAGDFSEVLVTNEDNTGVASWRILMLDAPADSANYPTGTLPVLLALQYTDTPSVGFTPDVAGTYRVMLEVTDATEQIDRDIRCFGIPDARGFIRPPYQENPRPLPVAPAPGIGADGPWPVKPDEQNYAGNVRGWAGDAGAGQLDTFMRTYDDLPHQVVEATPFSAGQVGAPLYLVDLTAIAGPAEFYLPDSPRTGYVVRVGVLGIENAVTIFPQGGGLVGANASLELAAGGAVTLVHQGANNWLLLATSGAGGGEAGLAPVSVVSMSADSMTSETFENLSVALEKTFPSSFPNSAIYLIAPNLHDIPSGVVQLDNVVNYTLKSVGSTLGVYQVALPELQVQSVVNIEGCSLQGDVSGTGVLVLQNCAVGGNINVDDLTVKDCVFPQIGANVQVALGARFKDCTLGPLAITTTATDNPVVEIYGCKVDPLASVTFGGAPGVLRLDAFSYYWWMQAGASTDGTIEVAALSGVPVGGMPQSITGFSGEGGDTQGQIDSIVEALVALGLATDDR